MRPYGWSDDNTTLVEEEATHLREMAQHLIDGGKLRPLVADLNARGILTVSGKQWQTITVKRALVNPRMIGMREKNGTLEPSLSTPILDVETYDKLVELFNDPERLKYAGGNGTQALLHAGIGRCGVCGASLYSYASGESYKYKCPSAPTGCGRVSIKGGDLDAEITEGVLARLTDAGYRRALQGAVNALSVPQAAEEQLAELRGRLDALGEDYADGVIDRTQMQKGTARLRERIAKAKGLVERATTLSDIPEPTVEKILAWWEDASIQRRRDVVGVLLDHVTVKPSTGRIANGIHPDRLHYEWKTA
ncbi:MULTISPECIES: recombinase family protein [unclassified Rhodococcus (in: high G+C Gram-positive bacteria)]|uniref:recombinase family protein n=1 Tax=unclassified Rhodococcus (in: high G+C Gram-positive bacteria) TaxID=192944 RepID=UPI001595DAEF|nr:MULTISPECIES: recombinase family protein [unclassified Rhodococcus (in: high G+C Gram-positive bacteria)]